MKATDFFRALDESDLDPYEARYLMRVWRRGACWEKIDSIAKSTGMSRRRAYYTRAALLEKGWLVEVVADGRIAYSVAIPSCCVSAPDAQDVHDVHEQVHTVHEIVHDVHALPINRPKEDYSSKATTTVAPSDPVTALAEHFYRRTNIPPDSRRPRYEPDWIIPLKNILDMCHGDLETAKALLSASVDKAWSTPKADGAPYPVHAPKSLITFAANLAATQRVNVASDNADDLWRQALAVVMGTKTGDSRLLMAIRSIGADRIRMARETDVPELKRTLAHGYNRGMAATA